MIHHPITLRELTVARVVDVTPALRRVVLVGDQLGSLTRDGVDCPPFVSLSPDDHVKIFPPATTPLVLPTQDHGHLDWPEDPPAVARDYTVRLFDAARGELHLEALVDHRGPGAEWARDVVAGASLHVAGPRGSIEHPRDAARLLLVGDDAALPAIARFFDEAPDPSRIVAVVVADPANVTYPLPPSQVRWIPRDDHDIDPPTLDDAVRAELDSHPGAYVWVATEYSTARRLRHVLRECGVERRASHVTHYWRRHVDDHDERAYQAHLTLEAMTDLLTPFALRVAATIGVADAIETGANTPAAVAQRTGADPAAVRMLLELLARREVVRRDADGTYALLATGELLLADDELGWRDQLDLTRAPGHMDAAFVGLLPAVLTGRSGYEAVNGRSFWDALAADPDLGASFDEHLSEWAGDWIPEVLDHPVWRDLARIVDLAGGVGHLTEALLAADRRRHVTVIEQPATAARARERLAPHVAEERAVVVEGSFFDPLPTGYDAYVLVQVIHDWPDADAIRILRRCAEALGPTGRLLVIERLPADTDDLDDHDDHAQNVAMSLRMLTLFGATERTVDDYAALFTAAGLELVATHRPGQLLGIVEARRADATR